MKRFNKMMWVLVSFILVVFSNLGTLSVSAEEMGFSVKAIPSEHQRDKKQTYFDLRVEPGRTEELEVEIQNNTDKEITVLVNANTAITNDNGVIDYSQKELEKDTSLVHNFSELTKVEPEIKLAGKEVKTIKISIAVPKESFDGIILGGLHFSQKIDEKEKSDDTGVQVENRFSYVIGVRLSETDEALKPNINLLEVGAGQKNYRNTILAKIQNDQSILLNGIEVEAYVYEAKNTKDAIYYNKETDLEMAPNSSFSFGISTNNNAFKTGKYILKMTVKAKEEEFKFEKEFEIKSNEAQKLNDEAVELVEVSNDSWQKYLIIIIAILVVIIVAMFAYLLSKKKKTKKKKRKTRSKTKSNKKRKKN